MTQQTLNRLVAAATGEDMTTIARLGFVPLTHEPCEIDDDDEPVGPQRIDWDQYDLERNVACYERR